MNGVQLRRDAARPPVRAGSDAYVTASVARQLLALPVSQVRTVFQLGQITPVPSAPPDVIGLMNLAGRIVLAIDPRPRLGMRPVRPGPDTMAVAVEIGPDYFGLVVDEVGDVVQLGLHTRQTGPALTDPAWLDLSRGLHLLDGRLIIEVDLEALLGVGPDPAFKDPIEREERAS